MKKSAVLAIAIFLSGGALASAQEQAKGIDRQNQQIKDISTQRGPTENGNRQSVGTGRGIDFGKGKTVERAPLANPYRMTARRDVLIAAAADLMRERGMTVDDAASRPNEGVLISQPYTFAKGAVITGSELARVADLYDRRDESFSRARYTLTVEAQTIDGISNNVSVTAKVEGRSESALGSNWLTLTSSGDTENDFLEALIERVTGADPYANQQPEAANGNSRDSSRPSDAKGDAKGETKPARKPQQP